MSKGANGELRPVVYRDVGGNHDPELRGTKFLLKATSLRTAAVRQAPPSPIQRIVVSQRKGSLEAEPRELLLRSVSRLLGSEVSGTAIDFTAEPDPAAVLALRRAVLRRRVLFWREADAERVTTEHLLRWGAKLGELENHPFTPKLRGEPRVQVFHYNKKVLGGADLWHQDGSWREQVPFCGFIRLKICPPLGGDTLFADQVAACSTLPPKLRARIEGLRAIHHDPRFLPSLRAQGLTDGRFKELANEFNHATVEHPIISIHPETGEEMLRVNPAFTTGIVGMGREESDALLKQLYWHCFAQPELQCRFKWTGGAICLWDNRALCHYATSDFWPHERRMERICCLDDSRFHIDATTSASSRL